MIQTMQVGEGAANQRLDVFVAAELELPRSQVTRLLKAGRVTVNGTTARASYLTQTGDSIRIEFEEKTVEAVTAPELPVVYEDADIIVIDKPAALTAHAGAGTSGQATVADFARVHSTDPDLERPGIVHRLDRDTSGLMVIAKSAAAKATMQEQFRRHAVAKTYLLLAVGRVEPEEAVIRLPIGRDPAHPLRRKAMVGGREAATRYHVLETYPGYTLVEANPETGRTHQLRVHMSAIGHPVVGDAAYSPARTAKRPLGLTRHFLHAARLKFTAPSGAALDLESELPAELAEVIRRLREQV